MGKKTCIFLCPHNNIECIKIICRKEILSNNMGLFKLVALLISGECSEEVTSFVGELLFLDRGGLQCLSCLFHTLIILVLSKEPERNKGRCKSQKVLYGFVLFLLYLQVTWYIYINKYKIWYHCSFCFKYQPTIYLSL